MRDVAFSCDDNGVRFLKVSVWSLLTHYKGSESVRINVFDGFGGHSEAHRNEMRELVARFPKATLRYVNVEPAVEPYRGIILNREKSRWNVFAWAPIFTPQLLPDATGNVIHFDIDMLFNADVSRLFELELGDKLMACTYEYDKYGNNAGREIWGKGILPPSVECYFNTGVLVFNVEACRAERTWEKIINWYEAHYDIADRIEQDAWNALYHDRVRPLPVWWNFHDRAVEGYAKWPLDAPYWLGNPPIACLNAALHPAILHFWGSKKPWKVSHRPYRKLYHAAMRAVGQTVPREPFLAPYYNLVNALNLSRIRWRKWLFGGGYCYSRVKQERMRRLKGALLVPVEWLGIGLALTTFSWMPHRWMQALCDVASALMYVFDGQGKRRSLENLHVVMGTAQDGEGTAAFDVDAVPYDPTPNEARIIRRSYRNMCRAVGHAFWTCLNAAERVRCAGEMAERGKLFLAENKPAVTVSGHIGCWEILSQLAFLEGHPMMSVAKRIGTPAMTRLLMRARMSIGQEIVPADGAFKALMLGVQHGKSLGLLVDQRVDPDEGGIWVRFFGYPIPVSAAPAFFSAKAKAPIVVAWSRPLKDGRYRCEVVDEISAEEAKNIWRTTQRIADDLASVIRRHPSCWVMNYNFFSNVPSEEDMLGLETKECRNERQKVRKNGTVRV